jgi:hypothetical protein
MSRALRVKLSGGLGNQLFKTLFGIKLSMNTKKRLTIDTSWYDFFSDSTGKVQTRKLEVNYFPELRKLNFVKSGLPAFDKRLSQIARRTPSFFRKTIGYVTDSEANHSFSIASARILDGNFEKIELLPADSILCELLAFPIDKSDWLMRYEEGLGANFIALHVRMGDYRNLPEIYGFMSQDYYARAVPKIQEILNCEKVVLFSDDIDSAINWLQDKVEISDYVQPGTQTNSAETLRLMSTAKGLVMAHSTFSWWAAKIGTLNQTCNEVVMPSRFLSYEANVKHRLHYPKWHTIEV